MTAKADSVANNTKSTAPAPATSGDATFEIQYCPEVSELTKNEMIWSAKDQWKSYSESFSEQIGNFIGAQWIGVKLGKIICLYDSKESFDFPIALESIHTMLVFEPKDTTNWSVNVKGYKMCHSTNIKDCGFAVQKTKKEGDPYNEIKYQPASQNND